MKKLFGAFRRDRRGSGIVTVIISVSFILILGAILLFTSYTGYLIKAADRKSEVNFYDAETAMDEIRAGLQQHATSAIKSAYTEILIEYSHITHLYNNPTSYVASDRLNPSAKDGTGKPLYATLDKFVEANFQQVFREGLLAVTYLDGANVSQAMFAAGTYSVAGLRTFLTTALPAGAKVVLNPASDGSEGTAGTLITAANGKTVTLKNVSVRYTKNGYETNLSSDIVLYMPPFSYTATEYSLSNLNKLSIVTDTELRQINTTAALSGNVYAKKITLDNAASKLTYRDGILICAGDLNVGNSASFTTDNTAEDTSLWAGGINVGGNASLTLTGTVNVADDLTVTGSGASVTLGGSGSKDVYTGFGYMPDSSPLAFTSSDVPNGSSAIIINGRNTVLNMSALESLTLAGSGFINTTGASDTAGAAAYFAMGQSIAARSDQLAYLAPVNCLSTDQFVYTTNPYYDAAGAHFPTDATIAQIRSKIAALAASSAAYAYYGNVGGVTAMYSSSTRLVYFFLTFDTADKANAFYKGYFEQNDQAAAYLNQYLKSYSAAAETYSRGDTYYVGSGAEAVRLGLSGTAFSTTTTSPYTTSFYNLCRKLSATAYLNTGESADLTPYTYLVDTDAVAALFPAGSTEKVVSFYSEINADGTADASKAVGRIVSGDYTITAGETARAIICTGDVTVNADYTGLILAKGTIRLAANVSNSSDVSMALQAKCLAARGGKAMLDYLAVGSGTGGSTGGTEGTTWNLSDLVVYKNWKKS